MNHSLTVQNLSEKRGDPGPAGLECQEPVARDRGRQVKEWNSDNEGINKFSV